MQTLFRFLLEQSILNLFVVLMGIAAASILFGSFLTKKRSHSLLRSAIYAVGGTAAGLWNYISHDKEPSTQYLTVPVLAVGFFLLSMALVFPFIYYRNKKQRSQMPDGGAGT